MGSRPTVPYQFDIWDWRSARNWFALLLRRQPTRTLTLFDDDRWRRPTHVRQRVTLKMLSVCPIPLLISICKLLSERHYTKWLTAIVSVGRRQSLLSSPLVARRTGWALSLQAMRSEVHASTSSGWQGQRVTATGRGRSVLAQNHAVHLHLVHGCYPFWTFPKQYHHHGCSVLPVIGPIDHQNWRNAPESRPCRISPRRPRLCQAAHGGSNPREAPRARFGSVSSPIMQSRPFPQHCHVGNLDH